MATKIDMGDTGNGRLLLIDDMNTGWFDADGWQVGNVLEQFRMIRPDRGEEV